MSDPARALRDDLGAKIFVVAVGENNGQDEDIVGNGNEGRIIRFNQWRGIESVNIGPVADGVCSVCFL